MAETPNEIRAEIEQRFAKVACSPNEEQKFPIGPESAKRLGYSVTEIDSLPSAVTESFAGVGNPLALGQITTGQTVVDIGCGAGMDSILAARMVGPQGRVIGVDLVDAMLHKAKRNAAVLGMNNIEFQRGEADAVPIPDETADVVISNGVFNLCLDKRRVLAEVFRVLKPGGRIQMADILLDEGVSPQEVELKGAWSD